MDNLVKIKSILKCFFLFILWLTALIMIVKTEIYTIDEKTYIKWIHKK